MGLAREASPKKSLQNSLLSLRPTPGTEGRSDFVHLLRSGGKVPITCLSSTQGR